jgi:hypothetical protein
MKRKMFLLSMVVLALIVFAPYAWSQGVLNMPPNPVIVDDYNSWGAATIMGGMFDITISGIIDDWKYDVQNDTYRGWCMENNHAYPGIKDKQYYLYDSADTGNLPSVFIGKPWNKVNYLLNHKQGTRYDVQKALWQILGTDADSLVVDPKINEDVVNAMVAAANNNGPGFVPGPGQFVAVLILNDGFGPAATDERNQDTLIEVQLPAGCTLTPGYWKTHSKYAGSKKYDPTWAMIQPNGEDTIFYLSNQTWYQVLWTPPKKGNVYYILSFQFIAAKLNIAAVASSTPEVDAALFLADKFFKKFTPAQALTLKEKEKKLYIGLANILDSYNNGYIGPGHCSDSCSR